MLTHKTTTATTTKPYFAIDSREQELKTGRMLPLAEKFHINHYKFLLTHNKKGQSDGKFHHNAPLRSELHLQQVHNSIWLPSLWTPSKSCPLQRATCCLIDTLPLTALTTAMNRCRLPTQRHKVSREEKAFY